MIIEQVIFVPKYQFVNVSQQSRDDIDYIYDNLAAICTKLNIPLFDWTNKSEIDENLYTMVVVAGGDGSMLSAMKYAAKLETAVVYGINNGNLGFLTSWNGAFDSSPHHPFVAIDDDTFDFNDIITNSDKYILDSRILLGSEINNSNYGSQAVNELLITSSNRRNPLRYTIYINGNKVAKQSGDGVMVSTATGSTAYAMSAGGAIMSPSSTSMQIVPLAPHTLSSRPIVVNGDDRVTISVEYNDRQKKVDVISDGNEVGYRDVENSKGFNITISSSGQAHIVRPKGWNFFKHLEHKFNWG